MFSNLLKVDRIMLSDETAISNNWKQTLKWLNKYNKQESSNLNSQVQPKETNQLQDDAKIQPFFSNDKR